MRRFTRRARNRRSVLLALSGLVVVLVGLVLVAVYSPILALRTITVEGTSRIDADAGAGGGRRAARHAARPRRLRPDDRRARGVPAHPQLRDRDRAARHTRHPASSSASRSAVLQRNGGFELVDPAGVDDRTSPERPAGVPAHRPRWGDGRRARRSARRSTCCSRCPPTSRPGGERSRRPRRTT